tara:strand:- start:37 stop:639 length:603 start_codon:yes stop_codon:yes gene_type:complete
MFCNYSSKYKCKNKCIIVIKQQNICLKHFNLYYKKYVLLIQKIFKGYYVRKKLKKLFYNLPQDIQKIVLYYINLPIYYMRYYRKIQTIIYEKNNYLFINNKYNINKIINSYYLFNKYYIILNLNFLKYNYVNAKDLLCQLNTDFYLLINNVDIYTIIQNYNFLDNNLINIDTNYNTKNILHTIQILIEYIKIYENKYNLR